MTPPGVRTDGANTRGWLLWHLTRVQDDHVAGLAGVGQAWPDWRERFGLPFSDWETGYGQSPEEVAAVRVSGELLAGYHADVHALTLDYLQSITADELARVVDTHWDPPVTTAVRLVSVLGDVLQHLGQAAYVRGLAERRDDESAPLLRRPGPVVAADLRAGGVRRGGRLRRLAAPHDRLDRPASGRPCSSWAAGAATTPFHLKAEFDLTLVDLSPEMVAVSQRLNPECEHHVGDMRTVRLGREFDAVFVHDAIEYMITEDDLRQAVRTAYAHCRPGGVAVLVPDDIVENFEPVTDVVGTTARTAAASATCPGPPTLTPPTRPRPPSTPS